MLARSVADGQVLKLGKEDWQLAESQNAFKIIFDPGF